MKFSRFLASLFLLAPVACAQQKPAPVAVPAQVPAAATVPAKVAAPVKAPFPYVWGTAYHILPETTSEESGYFSIAEGHNGKVYVGTAKYNSCLLYTSPSPRDS